MFLSKNLLNLRVIAISLAFTPVCTSAQGFHNEAINDSALNMKAYDVSILNSWKFQGTTMQGTSCSNLASPAFKAYSPDGLSELRRLPRFDWSWSNAPYEPKSKGDCLPLKSDVTAPEFVRYVGRMLHLQEKGTMQESGFDSAWQKSVADDNAGIMAVAGQRPFRGSTAAGRFEDQNGTFVIEEQIRVGIRCSHYDLPGFSNQGKLFKEVCGADVRIIKAPKGKLNSLVASLDTHGGVSEDARWTQAIIAISQQQMRDNSERTRQIIANRQIQFQHDQAVRAQQNAQYQTATQAGYQQHNANEIANMNARHTPASDWVDYALDQQTVTGSGGTAVKVSSAYNQTWANGSGQYYQTNDPNANPNGSLPGNWTVQTPVHGNGTPY
jgi:hypothetical protein